MAEYYIGSFTDICFDLGPIPLIIAYFFAVRADRQEPPERFDFLTRVFYLDEQFLALDGISDGTVEQNSRDLVLGQKILRSFLNRFDGDFIVIIAGQYDYRHIGRVRMHFIKAQKTISVRKAEIEENQVKGPIFQVLQAALQLIGMCHFVRHSRNSTQEPADEQGIIWIVFDDQYGDRLFIHECPVPLFFTCAGPRELRN